MLLAVACSYPSPLTDDREEPGPSSSSAKKKKAAATEPDADAVVTTTEDTTETRSEPESPSAPLTCTMDAQCNSASRICESGKCVKGPRADAGSSTPTPPTTPACIADVQCDLGMICTQQRCKDGCHTDFDCPLDAVCATAGLCVQTTAPTLVECLKDGDCNPGNNGSGKICASNRCVPGCHQDNQCPGVTICIAGWCS